MGLNIIVYKYIGIETIEEFNSQYECDHVDRQEWFDSLRYAGDKDFVIENAFEEIGCEKIYYRPSNIEDCLKWVDGRIIENNKERLVNVLRRMNDDNSLVFRFSW